MALANSESSRLRTLMIGWLYADLMLVLLIAALGNVRAQPEPTKGPASQTASPAPSPSRPTPPPTPTPKKKKFGLDPNPITFKVRVKRQLLTSGDKATERRFQRNVHRKLDRRVVKTLRRQGIPAGKARIGLMITFGHELPPIGRAQDIARKANALARQAKPSLFRKAITKSYGSTQPKNLVDFEIYVYQ